MLLIKESMNDNFVELQPCTTRLLNNGVSMIREDFGGAFTTTHFDQVNMGVTLKCPQDPFWTYVIQLLYQSQGSFIMTMI